MPLKHILPQRFTTQLLIQTLQKIDQLPRSTEASVRESTDPRIIVDFKISGRRHCLKCTLKIAACSEEFMDVSTLCCNILRMLSYSFGNLVTMIMFYFMFVSQLYPHHEQFHIHDWSMIVFSREMTGAIKRRVVDPPTQGSTPPTAPTDDDSYPSRSAWRCSTK